MLTRWQEPIFERIALNLPFVRSQPLSTFSLACILGDGTYIFNGKVGSLFDLGLGTIHPGWILTAGGVSALIGHIILLANADRVDQAEAEHGFVTRALGFCRKIARSLTLGWTPPDPFLLGFAALALNGLALTLDALWEIAFFGANPAMLIQMFDGIIITAGLGAAMLSRFVRVQEWRDRLNAFAPKLLAYATGLGLLLGVLAVAPFMVLGGLFFVLGNAAQHHYALRMRAWEQRIVI